MGCFASGLAQTGDLLDAAERATAEALAGLGGAAPDLACVFLTGEVGDVESALVLGRELTGARVVIGCNAGGVIGAGRGVEARPAVSVWAAVLPGVDLRPFHLDVVRLDGAAGDALAVVGMPRREGGDKVALVLADPWTFPADAFVDRSTDALVGLPLVGGLAVGGGTRHSTRLLLDDRVYPRGAVGVVLAGPIGVRTMVSQGCRPVGPAMTVTAAEGNALLALAGAPALTKVAGVLAGMTPTDLALARDLLQVGIARDEYLENPGLGDFLVRSVVGIDHDRGAVLVGDVVEVGQTVQMHVRDAGTAAADLVKQLTGLRADHRFGAAQGALLFSCTGRGRALFPDSDHDVTAVRAALGLEAVTGFFAAGEIGPVGGRNHLHGFTASLAVFGSGPQ
jgi:small ligand-binding sensory domain FIST